MLRRAMRPSACVGTCPSRRSSSRSSTPSECAPPRPRRSRPHAGLPRRDRSGRRPLPTKRCRAKRSSISTKPTPWPRPISTSRTAFTTRPPSSCRKRSRPRPIGATSSSSCSKSISCGATRTRSSKPPRRCAPTSAKADDPDWNKVVIMGRQICPDERLFTEATTGGGRVDVDLEAGDSPLDLAFDDASADVAAAASAGLDLNLESLGRPAGTEGRPRRRRAPRDFGDDALDIGARTAAGLEAALFEDLEKDDAVGARRPTSSADSLAVTQESPTIERPGSTDWDTVESPTAQYSSPTRRPSRHRRSKAPLPGPRRRCRRRPSRSRGARSRRRSSNPRSSSATSDYTAEIDLDDLGLDVKDLEGLPSDLGDLPMAAVGRDGHARATGAARRRLGAVRDGRDEGSAQRRRRSTISSTSVLEDQDATMLSPGFDDRNEHADGHRGARGPARG